MQLPVDPTSPGRLWALVLGTAAGILGAIALAGWALGVPQLRVVVAGFPAMSVNTAMGLLLCGLSLGLLAVTAPGSPWRWPVYLNLSLVGTLAALTVAEHMLGDSWYLLHAPAHALSLTPTELISAPHTAVTMLCLAIGLWLLVREDQPARVAAGQWFGVAALGALTVVLAGYVFSVPFFYRVDPQIGMALHTWLGLVLVSIGMLALRPDVGFARLWAADALGSRMLRRLLPIGGLLLFLFYLLGVWGEQVVQTWASALSFVAILLVSLLTVAASAERLNAEARRRQEAEARYQAFFDGNPDAVLVVDGDGRLVEVNRQCEVLTGHSRTDLLGKPVEMLVPEHLRDAHVQQRRHFQTAPYARPLGVGLDLALLQRDGSECPVTIAIRPVSVGERALNILSIRDMRETRRLEEDVAELSRVAGHDSLTGLPNRRLLRELLNQAFAAARRNRTHVAICYCDLDGFKSVNDSQGHAAGDALLCEGARRMRDCVREQDTVARVGGDEFVVALTGLERADDAHGVADKVLKALSEPYQIEGQTRRLTVSIGISVFPDDGDQADTLLRRADDALLNAKQEGKNQRQRYRP